MITFILMLLACGDKKQDSAKKEEASQQDTAQKQDTAQQDTAQQQDSGVDTAVVE